MVIVDDLARLHSDKADLEWVLHVFVHSGEGSSSHNRSSRFVSERRHEKDSSDKSSRARASDGKAGAFLDHQEIDC